MPIPLCQKILPLKQTIRVKEQLTGNDTDWIACSYSGIYKNQNEQFQPHVRVGFREISNGFLSDHVIPRKVLLTSLGQFRLGTIWKQGVCQSMVEYDSHEFDVDFRSGGWRFNSFGKAIRNGTEPPYPQEIYPLEYSGDQNWMLEFRLPLGGKLVIPCLEFFSRCYGRSQELNRILATFPWKGSKDAHDSQLYAPIDGPEESKHRWKVKLRKRLKNGDTTFLAHAKYDPYTELAAKRIFGQIEEQYKPENIKPLFIEVQPWFQGPAEMKVRGIWFDNNRSFLALQVMGCSDPDGIIIERSRENANKTDGVDPDSKGIGTIVDDSRSNRQSPIQHGSSVPTTLEPLIPQSRRNLREKRFTARRRILARHRTRTTIDCGDEF